MIPTMQHGQLGRFNPGIPSVLWTPASLSAGPQVWLNDTSTLTTSGAEVLTWADLSGNGNTFSAGIAGERPGYAGTQNGRRVINFDGTADYMSLGGAAAQAMFKNKAAGWAMFVSKKAATDGAGTNRCLLWGSQNTAGGSRFTCWNGTTTAKNKPTLVTRNTDGSATGTLNASAECDTGYHIYLIAMDWANGDGFIYIDGTQDASNLALTSNANTSNTNAADSLYLACRVNGSGTRIDHTDLTVGEVLIGNGTLPSSTEIDKLMGYAAYRWGLQGNLPGGHPYKTTPP